MNKQYSIELLKRSHLNWLRFIVYSKESPIIINSGFRNATVNRKVGGVATSQHLTGQAADIRPRDASQFQRLVELLKSNPCADQLLTGPGWLHISWTPFAKPRRHIRIGYYG